MTTLTNEEHLIQQFSHSARCLHIHWKDGHRSSFAALWLRDNCPEERDPRNGQRLMDITELPRDPTIHAVNYLGDRILALSWGNESKQSLFDLEWLWNHCRSDNPDWRPRTRPAIWMGNQAAELIWSDYSEVLSSEAARWEWLDSIAQYGIGFLENVPCKDQQVLEVARLAGFIYETNYGRIFDVRSEPSPNNLANTDWKLGLHTDNPYRDPVPGFQILHCLQASPDGGESVFADGFALAERLKKQDWAAFLILASTPVRFRFQDVTTDLSAERPLLQLNLRGELVAVHFNNRSIAPLGLSPDRMSSFYLAYRELAKLIQSPDFEFRIKLQNGDAVMFDNHRILHGRTAFNADRCPRHLQGCYVNRDSVFSNLRVLSRQFQEAMS